MKHKWSGPFPSLESGPDASERRGYICERCGSRVICAAFGHIPERQEFGIGMDDPIIQPRKITGWQTPDDAAQKSKIPDDCDAALVERIMET